MIKLNVKQKRAIDFDEYLAEQLKNSRTKKYYDEYEKQLKADLRVG